MALADAFLSPLGLAALASLVPLVLYYLVKPEPDRVAIPTVRFLVDAAEEERRGAAFRTLRRNWLLLVQALLLVAVALALASPYVTVSRAAADEAVVVLDASASMATETGDGTRFERAVARARDATAETTSVVVAGGTPRVALGRGTAPEADRALAAARVTHAPGDLGSAVALATDVAGEGATIVVVSDFAGATEVRHAVGTARARGLGVDHVQVGGGGRDNVGVTGYAFDGRDVTVTIRNAGDRPATRTVRLGAASGSVTLQPGDVATRTFEIPADGGRVTLSPGDSFPVDDAVPIVAPPDPTVDVLVLTNDENRFLTTALSLVPGVTVTVETPPVTIDGDYDVVVFSSVDPGKVLPGNVATARAVLADGGGVAIQAQPDLARIDYGDLLLVTPRGMRNGTPVEVVSDDPLVADITFGPPERYLSGSLREGRSLVEAADGTPLVATARRGPGGILYYGFIEDAADFKYNFRYPVFWKRAVYELSARPTLAELNRRTGTRLAAANGSVVVGPDGERLGPAAALDRVGVYRAGDRRVGAALLSEDESNVTAASIGDLDAPGARSATRRAPLDLTPLLVAAAIGLGFVELLALRRRGDL